MFLDYRKSKETKENILFVDDIGLEGTYITGAGGALHVLNPKSAQRVIELRVKDLLGDGEHHLFSSTEIFPLEKFETKVIVNLSLHKNHGKYSNYKIKIGIKPEIERWNNRFSFLDYKEKFRTLAGRRGFLDEKILNSEKYVDDVLIDYYDKNQIAIVIDFKCENETVAELFNIYLEEIRAIDKLISKDRFFRKLSSNSVIAEFNFPEHVQVACEQYLLYFVQFLKDLGIGASAKVREEAGKILFSVRPDNELDALDNIRNALAVYLNLPSNPIFYEDRFTAMRLRRQIKNLRDSQKIAASELRFEESLLIQSQIIREKNLIIRQQNRIIEKITSKEIMMNSLQNREEFEKIVEGLEFGVIKWLMEHLGIKINPVKLLKSLGERLLGKDEEIVTLDLAEQEAENDANN
jgi:hypothetical protein